MASTPKETTQGLFLQGEIQGTVDAEGCDLFAQPSEKNQKW
jgi:hypothetical protein